MERLLPAEDIHVNTIVDFVAEYCYSTGISDGFGNGNEFSIYPNPANDILILNIDNANKADLTLNIYNVIGKLISSETLKQNQQQINIGDLSNGIYIVEIKSRELSGIRKLIIQR